MEIICECVCCGKKKILTKGEAKKIELVPFCDYCGSPCIVKEART